VNYCLWYNSSATHAHAVVTVLRSVSVKVVEAPLAPVMISEIVFSPLTNSFPLILKLDTEEAVGQRK